MEGANKRDNRTRHARCQNLGNLFPEMTACLFCYIMFVGSKSLGPAHTQGQWIIPMHGSQKAEITGSHRESLPTTPCFFIHTGLLLQTEETGLCPSWSSAQNAPPHGLFTSLKSLLGHHLFSEALFDCPISNCTSPQPLFPLSALFFLHNT